MSCGHNTNSHDILYIVGSGCYNMYIWVVIHLLLPSMGILPVICPYSACVTFRLKVVNFSTRAVQTPAPANLNLNSIFKSGSRRKYFSVISEFIFFKNLFTTLLIVNHIVIYSNILVNNNLIFPFNAKCSLKYEIIFHNFVCRSFCRSFPAPELRLRRTALFSTRLIWSNIPSLKTHLQLKIRLMREPPQMLPLFGKVAKFECLPTSRNKLSTNKILESLTRGV